MKRKIYQKLLDWKANHSQRTALLIEGARRVGKSYIVEEFARNEYRSHLIVDFGSAGDEVRELFERYISDLDTLFLLLSNIYGVKLHERESLIVFDEVQMCPKARAAIKYLVKDGRYSYIETGSLVSIRENVKDIVIPSEERHLRMDPMDFEEFCWAMGDDMLPGFIRDRYADLQPLGQAMHRKAMNAFRQYLVVGGMPQAVSEYVESRDFDQADQVKRDILALYRADISKHAHGYERRVEGIFDELPGQLQKHEKKFSLSSLGKGARFREYESSFLWLVDSMIVNPCYNSTQPSLGLKLNRDNSSFKLYMADTGLLISHSFDESDIVAEDLYRKLLFGKLELNEGMLFENVVAQTLVASGRKLFFYSNSTRADAAQRMEIDFLISKGKVTSRHNVSAIEVKSGKRYTLSSLNKFRRQFPDQLHMSYVIHVDDMRREDGVTYLPVYMAHLL